MADNEQYIKVLNERLLAQLDDEQTKISERRAKAKRELLQCDTDDDIVEEKRNSILQSQALQLAYLGGLPQTSAPTVPLSPPPPSAQNSPQPIAHAMSAIDAIGTAKPAAVAAAPRTGDLVVQKRARVGPQRYFILTSLRAVGPLSLGEIIKQTHLQERRVRDQLRSDINDGVVDEVAVGLTHKFRLSKAGGELLMRFEEYRKATGKGLPTLDEARSENPRQESADIFN
jgi:hypothetical protein